MKKAQIVCSSVAITGALLTGQSAHAGGHTWRISEVFSTPDGLIQFVELKESFSGPGETNVASTVSAATGHSVGGGTVAAPTTGKHFLIATQSFADLPGAPVPDRIIPAAQIPLIGVLGDTLTFGGGLDVWNFTALPTDCVSSKHKGLPPTFTVTTGPATPTNYAGNTFVGPFNACPQPCEGDTNNSGAVDVDDLIAVILDWGCTGKACEGDVDGSKLVDVDDLIVVILNWGPC